MIAVTTQKDEKKRERERTTKDTKVMVPLYLSNKHHCIKTHRTERLP